MPLPQPIRYSEESSLELNEAAAMICVVTLLPADSGTPSFVVVSGCPACDHSTFEALPLEVIGSPPAELVRRGTSGSPHDLERLQQALESIEPAHDPVFKAIAIRCHCSESHPGAGQRNGCGRFWSLTVTLAGSVSAAKEPPTFAHLSKASTLKEWSANELPSVRKAATAWQAGFAGLIALVSTVLLIKGPESVHDLGGGARMTLVVLLGIALLLAMVASVLALLAANGLPGRRRTDELEPRVAAHEEAITAARRLRLSILAAVSATLLMAVSVAVSWLGVSESTQTIMVTFSGSADPVCGVLLESSDEAKVTVLVINGDIRSFSLPQVRSIRPSDDCAVD
jgi:hypothetical protein